MDYDYDFDLIGISCHAPDYRLCWALNQKLGISLGKKEEGLVLRNKKSGEDASHAIFEYFGEEDHVEYFLLLNKTGASYLVPEQKAADFLFILRNNYAIDASEILQQIKTIDLVQTAFRIDAENLKSRENLLF